jgi:predicted Rossmann-fold nucleotide-binding protein
VSWRTPGIAGLPWFTGPVAAIRELTTLGDLDRLLTGGATSMQGWRIVDLDLTARGPQLTSLDARGAIFFGCEFDPATEVAVRAGGALLFPELPDLPFAAYRASLYAPAELYDTVLTGGHYRDSVDARCYRWFLDHRPTAGDPDVADTLATALHDHAVSDAFADLIAGAQEETPGRAVVAVMGGHALERGTAGYGEAARLGRTLARGGDIVATGGGPGAMEATNLGAWLAGADDDALPTALAELGEVPAFAPNVHRWALCALAIRERFPQTGVASVSVPTWYFGHEPPNVFASGIAKFFSNAIREDVLLRGATRGVIVLPGAAGTVQEIFQSTTGAYYAEQPEQAVPLVLVGRDYWTTTLPVWPLLESLAAGRPMRMRIALVDSPSEAADALATLTDPRTDRTGAA